MTLLADRLPSSPRSFALVPGSSTALTCTCSRSRSRRPGTPIIDTTKASSLISPCGFLRRSELTLPPFGLSGRTRAGTILSLRLQFSVQLILILSSPPFYTFYILRKSTAKTKPSATAIGSTPSRPRRATPSFVPTSTATISSGPFPSCSKRPTHLS
jgi:hypothetical protein